MPVVDPNQLTYENFKLRETDFTNGKDESSSIAQGEIGAVAVVEVGEDGQASSYDALLTGQALDPHGNSAQGKIFVDLDADDAGTAVADSAEFRLVAKDKNDNRRVPLTPWYPHRDSRKSDTRQRLELTPRQPFVKAGRLIALEVKDETAAVTVDRSGSTIELPYQGGY